MRFVSVIILITTLASRAFAADPLISIVVYPRFQQAPATIRVTVVIQRDTRNRQACVSIEGDTGYSRSSCWEHVGEGARYQTVIYYPDLPAGRYAAQGTVVRVVEGKQVEVPTPVFEFRLLGFGDSPDSEP